MNTPWNWIFQRPHIFALKLQEQYNTTVIQKVYFQDRHNKKAEITPERLQTIFQLPFSKRFMIVGRICDLYTRLLMQRYRMADILWLTHPEQYLYIPYCFRGLLVYDCMDNHAALSSGKRRKDALRYEERLLDRADIVFASSEKLAERINRPEKTVLIRNGFLSDDKLLAIKEPKIKKTYQIGYIGTVSEWFDWKLLIKSKCPDIRYQIIGPTPHGIEVLVKDPRITFLGRVDHSQLSDAVHDFDALIMPFEVNEIVTYVDPVKLYEYIQYGKSIISVWYPEIERFEPFVYFYRNQEEYDALIERLSSEGFPAKYTQQQRQLFLEQNSWEKRYTQVQDVLNRS